MESPASPSVLGALVVLALADGTSVGTLGLPVWMLAQPRIRPVVVTAYLLAIAAFYWVLGVALVSGLRTALPSLERFGETAAAAWLQLGIGVALFLASFLFDGPIGRWRRQRRERSGRESRWQRWKARLVGPDARVGTAVRLGLGAGVVEAASMVPYLAAIGLLTAQRVPVPASAVILVGYCVVMVLPAFGLLALRILVARRAEPLLTRLAAWFSSNADEILAWTIGVIGFLVATDAVGRIRATMG